MSNRHVVIVAGGTGSRMKQDLPKQFLTINDIPIIIHTMSKFISAFSDINLVVVMHESYLDYFKDLLKKFNFDYPISLIKGGSTRFDSCKNGIESINSQEGDLIAIHDAARPLLSAELIKKCFDVASKNNSCVPVIAVKESLRLLNSDGTSEIVDRDAYKIVQTPQVFESNLLNKSYEVDFDSTFTDDASVVEKISGKEIMLCEGEEINIKITTPSDLEIASKILKR